MMLTVILLRPQTAENIGFIARSMKNFDLTKLILIDPLCNIDDSLKIAKQAKDIIKNTKIQDYNIFNKIKKDFDLVVGTTSVIGSDYNIPRTPLSLDEFAKKINNQRVALVFGNEANGLTNQEISYCDFVITIPSSKNYPALNISHAAAIVFYEVYKQHGTNKLDSHISKAGSTEKAIILDKLNEILHKLEFRTPHKVKTQQITWKRLIEKAALSKRESFVVMGLLKKIQDNL